MGANLGKEIRWEHAIQTVLEKSAEPLHYVQITEHISTLGLRQSLGGNPAASVASALSKSLREPDSPFIKLGGGLYSLKNQPQAAIASEPSQAEEEIEEPNTGALKAFGMFWQRNQISWTGTPKLLGLQQMGALQVNFAEQVGVYLLHDRERVIYVGRASATLYARLKVHTSDRLGGRWDRFSWFGLRSVGEDAALAEPSGAWTHEVVIETLEALLIETMEPPLNRKGGDNFSGVEYLQVPDPELDKRKKKELMNEMMKRAGLSE